VSGELGEGAGVVHGREDEEEGGAAAGDGAEVVAEGEVKRPRRE
jgi:hypothetical protein